MAEKSMDFKRKPIGVIKFHKDGWKRELNLVSWYGNPFEYDIRDWKPGHKKMTRGIHLDFDSMKAFVNAYMEWRKENRVEKGTPVKEIRSECGVPVDVYAEIASLPKETKDGFKYLVRSASWNDQKAKVDIRGWRGNRMKTGISLSQEEADELCRLFLETV